MQNLISFNCFCWVKNVDNSVVIFKNFNYFIKYPGNHKKPTKNYKIS